MVRNDNKLEILDQTQNIMKYCWIAQSPEWRPLETVLAVACSAASSSILAVVLIQIKDPDTNFDSGKIGSLNHIAAEHNQFSIHSLMEAYE